MQRNLVVCCDGKGVDKWFGGAFGVGLTDNIQQAYRWIADEYRDGDRLYFFGFSRGAYPVRSLRADAPGRRQGRQCRVRSLTVRRPKTARGPALSRYGLLRKTVRGVARGSKPRTAFTTRCSGARSCTPRLAIDEERGPFAPSLWKVDGSARERVEQVWFAGVHCNVGGGYVDPGLSDHALLWMAAKAMKAGLALDYRYLAMRIDPNCHGELRDSKTLAYKLIRTTSARSGARAR